MAFHHQDQIYSTAHYFWSTRDRLGHGATGSVYIGYHKKDGTRTAVKVFAGGPDFKSLKREIEVVRSLPHQENIVRLEEVEEDSKYGNKVIIMELCTGGSLYEVIDSPENAYGLSETEFKQVIYDVAKGLQHLRSHNFIHRDIKPGNIMRCQKPDGSYVFKLADFGTARELGPEETFTSLHGTEEYLHPFMYERALVNTRAKNDFPAKVDLWSVGATFFHAATGRLPFQPYKKRDDRGLMYKILSQKKSGVISGWQVEPEGRIIYNSNLPQDTRLSLGLKLLITNILAGLMENDLAKIMDFEDFFKEIEKIHRKKVIDVFCVYSCTTHKIFIDHNENNSFTRLKQLIQMQTGLEPNYQELFYENLPYRQTDPLPACKLPTTTAERPIFVFGGNPKKTSDLQSHILPPVPSIPPGPALSNDFHFAKECMKTIFYFKFIAEEINRLYNLMHQAALCFSHTVRYEYSLVKQHLDSVEQLNNATCRVLSSQIAGLNNIRATLSSVNQSVDGMFSADISKLDMQIRQKQDLHVRLKDAPYTLRSKMKTVMKEEIIDSWDSKYSADIFNRSNEILQFMLKTVDTYYRSFMKDRRHKALSEYDQKVHNFTKSQLHQQLSEALDKVVSLQTGREQVYSKLGEWFNQTIPMRFDIDDIGKKTKHHEAECNRNLMDLDKWEEEHMQALVSINQRVIHHLSNRAPPQATHVELPEGIFSSPLSPVPGVEINLPNNFVSARYMMPSLKDSLQALDNAVKEQKARLERNIANISHQFLQGTDSPVSSAHSA